MLIKFQLNNIDNIVLQIKQQQQQRILIRQDYNKRLKELLDKELEKNFIKKLKKQSLKRKVNIVQEVNLFREGLKSNKVITNFQSFSYLNNSKNARYKTIFKWDRDMLKNVKEDLVKYIING